MVQQVFNLLILLLSFLSRKVNTSVVIKFDKQKLLEFTGEQASVPWFLENRQLRSRHENRWVMPNVTWEGTQGWGSRGRKRQRKGPPRTGTTAFYLDPNQRLSLAIYRRDRMRLGHQGRNWRAALCRVAQQNYNSHKSLVESLTFSSVLTFAFA